MTARSVYHPAELAYAHLGGARLAVAPPRWPARVLFIESPSAPGFPSRSDEARGVEVLGFTNAISALLAVPAEQPAAIVAPTDMVHVDFLAFIEAVVAWTEIPVIVGIAPHAGGSDLAYRAVEAGARSMLTLPCRPDQLAVALRGVSPLVEEQRSRLVVGRLSLDPQAYVASVDGQKVSFTPREFLLVQHLMQASPSVVRVEELAAALATYDDGSVSATRVLVLKVRKKLDAASQGAGELLETVRTIGYRIADDAPEG